jgi:hypothetical protein
LGLVPLLWGFARLAKYDPAGPGNAWRELGRDIALSVLAFIMWSLAFVAVSLVAIKLFHSPVHSTLSVALGVWIIIVGFVQPPALTHREKGEPRKVTPVVLAALVGLGFIVAAIAGYPVFGRDTGGE